MPVNEFGERKGSVGQGWLSAFSMNETTLTRDWSPMDLPQPEWLELRSESERGAASSRRLSHPLWKDRSRGAYQLGTSTRQIAPLFIYKWFPPPIDLVVGRGEP